MVAPEEVEVTIEDVDVDEAAKGEPIKETVFRSS